MKRQLPALIVACTYLVSFFLPTANIDDITGNGKPILGFDAFLLGWTGYGLIPELANAFFLCGLIAMFCRSMTMAVVLGCVAFGLGMTAPAIYDVRLSQLGPGYFQWMGSFLVLAIAAYAYQPRAARLELGQAR